MPNNKLRSIVNNMRKLTKQKNQRPIGIEFFIVKNQTGTNYRTVEKYANANRFIIKYCIEYCLKCWKQRDNAYHNLQE